MAKKINNSDIKLLKKMFGAPDMSEKVWTKKDLKRIFSSSKADDMTPEDYRIMIAAAVFIQNNITPETYNMLYELAVENPAVHILPLDLIFDDQPDNDIKDLGDDDDDWDFDEPQGVTGFPMKDADKKSLLLKIQLRGVTKPPLWREVMVPADIDFLKLHDIIQILFGWMDCHLWEFEEKPYSEGYRIGMPSPENANWGDGPTDKADETPISKVLKKAGDKMVYVYDFGDDWIHDITVKEVIDKKTEHPVCTKYKSGDPVEDIGGVWGLADYREQYGAGDMDMDYVNRRLSGKL